MVATNMQQVRVYFNTRKCVPPTLKDSYGGPHNNIEVFIKLFCLYLLKRLLRTSFTESPDISTQECRHFLISVP